jgi:hypothetical protein
VQQEEAQGASSQLNSWKAGGSAATTGPAEGGAAIADSETSPAARTLTGGPAPPGVVRPSTDGGETSQQIARMESF